MSGTSSSRNSTFRICFIGMMAAICFVSNYISFPIAGTRIHIGNAVCVLCGLLFGTGAGFLSAGIGNLLFDLVGGYGAECIITFINKGAIALVAALIAYSAASKPGELNAKDHARIVLGAALGALTYFVLYMLKTFIFGLAVDGMTMDAVTAKLISRIPSIFNAVFAAVVAPVFFGALRPALRGLGIFEKNL